MDRRRRSLRRGVKELLRIRTWFRRERLKLYGLFLLAAAPSAGYGDELHQASFLDGERTGPLVIEPVYIGEVYSNTRGGKSTDGATQYQGLLDLAFKFDLARTRSKLPGNLFLLAQNTHGRGLTEDFIGDTQVLSNIDSFNNIMQVGEYWWESRWLDDDVTMRLGKQDFNTEFQYLEAAEYFVQSTFGLSPSTAFPTYPNQAMGAVALLRLNESWLMKTGVWSAFATGGSWGFSESDAYLVVGELERHYSRADDEQSGIIAVGALYESSGVLDGRFVQPVREYYVQWEHVALKENGFEKDCQQGLALFGGYYPRFPGDQPIEKSIGDSAVGGLTYTGLFAGRDEDVIGIGVAWSKLFQGGTNRETITEAFYRIRCKPKLSLQPDLQYISSPSGVFKDSLAVGLRFVAGL